ncbi:MAG: hypothetical protein ABIP51_23930, partial [Bacteroidia bacterium]
DRVISERMHQQFKNNLITNLSLDYKGNVELKNLTVFKELHALNLSTSPVDFELIACFKHLEELSLGNFNGSRLKNILLNKDLKKFEVIYYFDGQRNFEYFKMLKKLETITIPNITNEELLKLNGHPALKVLQVTTMYDEQRKFIKNNRLSYTVKEVGYAGR